MSGKKEFMVLFLILTAMITPGHSKFRFKKRKAWKKEVSSESSSDFDQRPAKSENTQKKPFVNDGKIQQPQVLVNQTEIPLVVEDLGENIEECGEKPYYDYNVLVLMWPDQYCKETNDCTPQWEQQWDQKTPLLRGYWPASGQPYYYECFADSDSQGDPFCQHQAFGQKEEIQQFLNSQINELKQKSGQWYPFPKNGQNQYYKEQWLKHGSCYLSNMIEDNPKAYDQSPQDFNRTIFTEYFKSGIEKVKELGLTLSHKQKFWSKEDFAERIGFEGKQDHFNLICGDDNEVDEIHICYNRTRIPGKEITVECPNYENCDQHKYFVIS